MRAIVGLVTISLLLITIAGVFGSAKIFAYAANSGSAIHEIEGLIVALIAVVALSGVGILAGLHMVASDVSAARITQIALARQVSSPSNFGATMPATSPPHPGPTYTESRHS